MSDQPSFLELLEATQPLLMVAMHEAHKHGDGEFLTQLQTQYATNLDALNVWWASHDNAKGKK